MGHLEVRRKNEVEKYSNESNGGINVMQKKRREKKQKKNKAKHQCVVQSSSMRAFRSPQY
jgi:hypothetical protein